MRSESTRVQAPITPNLIPMIDVMFLLLLFFLLGADMLGRERAELVLAPGPNARIEDSARTGETNVDVQHRPDVDCAAHANGACRIAEHWRTLVRGIECGRAELVAFLHDDVNVRADRAAPYGEVQHVLEACGKAGIAKVSLAADRGIAR
jgi:biopolymer transport protein ExbD